MYLNLETEDMEECVTCDNDIACPGHDEDFTVIYDTTIVTFEATHSMPNPVAGVVWRSMTSKGHEGRCIPAPFPRVTAWLLKKVTHNGYDYWSVTDWFNRAKLTADLPDYDGSYQFSRFI